MATTRPKLNMLQPRVAQIDTSTARLLTGTSAAPAKWSSPGRPSADDRGYGWQWKQLRAKVLKRDDYRCQACKRAGRITPAREVDHIVNKASGGTDDLENLQSLCKPCHAEKTLHEAAGFR